MTKIDRADTDGALPEKEAAPEHVATFQTGLSAESRAAALFMAKGCRILARHFRTPHGEIDLVANWRSLLAKARARRNEAAFAVTPRQQTQVWLVEHLIAPRRLPRHLLAAFDAST